jgi:hypothetical protein
MISTNRIFDSAHGPEIPNLLEIVAGLYSIGLPRRLSYSLHDKELIELYPCNINIVSFV